VIYANTKSEHGDGWRDHLRHAKENLINQDYQNAIVEAEIAVEVTLASVLWELLTKRKKLGNDTTEWILSRVQAASERSKKVMELAIGKKVTDIDPVVYKNWSRNVADKRNRIVHQGEIATKEEAVGAIGAAFEFIWLLLELVNKQPVDI
jgi:HEPN domain-containing protein